MELWRRVILLVFVCVALWLAKLASLAPVILVSTVDFAEKQQKEGSYMGVRRMTEEKQRLSDMPLNEYIAEVTGGGLFHAEGNEWEGLFSHVMSITEGKGVPTEWSKRLPSDQHPMKVLFFRADEPPVNTFSKYFRKANDRVYVSRTKGDRTEYLELEYRVYSDDDFHFGSGLSNYPHPPTYLFFPLPNIQPVAGPCRVDHLSGASPDQSRSQGHTIPSVEDGPRRYSLIRPHRTLFLVPFFHHRGHAAGIHRGLAAIDRLLAVLFHRNLAAGDLSLVCVVSDPVAHRSSADFDI
ncbi:MAG: hypothetical protein HYX79_05025 [Chloroflexi bacterium]|nr:hypothetical protein [Chloroflexota bacterium]